MSIVSSVSAHMDRELKQSAEDIFQAFGMTPSEAIELFYQQVAQSRDLPFAKRKTSVSNSETETIHNRYSDKTHKQNGLAAEPANGEQSAGLRNYIKLHRSPDEALMLKEETFFRDHQAQLQQQYPNQFVAIHQGEVVDYDIDDEDLIDRRVEKYGKKIVLIRHVDSDPDEVITIRSHIIL